jgi:hypothetical protein
MPKASLTHWTPVFSWKIINLLLMVVESNGLLSAAVGRSFFISLVCLPGRALTALFKIVPLQAIFVEN